MEPIKIDLPSGLYRNGTAYQSVGRWHEAQFMRWSGGIIRPHKGWDLAFDTAPFMSGNVRAAFAWNDNDGLPYIMAATNSHVYVHDGTSLDDVTPSGFTTTDGDAASWTLDSFGELGIACNDEAEAIYEWQPGGGGDLTVVTNSPDALATFTTEERFIIALGADGDPRKVAWPNGEFRTVWTPTLTNRARELLLQSKGVLMCGAKVRGASLIWSSEELFLFRYIGLPDVYAAERVASDCGIVGRNAHKVVDSIGYWMGKKAFWRYAGYVETIPCDIADDVFSNLNTSHAHKVWLRHDPEFGEIHFHYPRGAETECSHRAILNYREGHWTHDALPRPAGVEIGIFSWPIMITSEGRFMKHEVGYEYDESVFFLEDDGVSMLLDDDGVTYLTDDPGDDAPEVKPYAISGPFEIGNGDRRLMVDEIWPDEKTQGDCNVSFYFREAPNATETTLGPYTAADRIGVMATARQVRIELEAAQTATDFRIGTYRAVVKTRGRH